MADQRQDNALLQALAERDLSALSELYDSYGRIAHTLAYRILGDPESAEDVVQDAFLAAWRGAGTFRRERRHARSWRVSVGPDDPRRRRPRALLGRGVARGPRARGRAPPRRVSRVPCRCGGPRRGSEPPSRRDRAARSLDSAARAHPRRGARRCPEAAVAPAPPGLVRPPARGAGCDG